MFNGETIHAKNLDDNHIVFIQKAIFIKDDFDTSMIHKYYVFIKGHNNHLYNLQMTDDLFEAHVFFVSICKNYDKK